MVQPEGYEDGTDLVCHLKQTLHGLKQSGHEWNHKIPKVVSSIGFKRLDADHCVYVRQDPKGFNITAIWVDDAIIMGMMAQHADNAMNEIGDMFKMTRSVPQLFLSIKIKHKKHCITLSQGQYIWHLLELFNMHDVTPISTPLDPSITINATTNEDGFEHPSLYQATIGSLMYAALGTHPDITFTVHMLSQFSSHPSKHHWTAIV